MPPEMTPFDNPPPFFLLFFYWHAYIRLMALLMAFPTGTLYGNILWLALLWRSLMVVLMTLRKILERGDEVLRSLCEYFIYIFYFNVIHAPACFTAL